LLGRQWNINGIDVVSCSEIVCRLPEKSADRNHEGHRHDSHSHKEDRVYVEADGELLGRLPARMTMAHDALSLVVPA